MRKLLSAIIVVVVSISMSASASCKNSKHAAAAIDEMNVTELISAAQDAAKKAMLTQGRKPKADRKEWAEQGKEFAERCVKLAPNNPECYYWRAVNTGLYHSVKVIGYQKGIKQMIADCEKVISLGKEDFDHAGPYRIQGEIYTQLPETTGHPDSIARDLSLGENMLRKAVKLAPEYPENHIALAQNLFMQDRFDDAFAELSLAKQQTPKFRIDSSYSDWQKTIALLMKKIERKQK